jgi:hypothetical protein
MKGTRTVGIILLVVGLVIMVPSLLADIIGLGDPSHSFGELQIVGTVVGAILTAGGLFLMRRK